MLMIGSALLLLGVAAAAGAAAAPVADGGIGDSFLRSAGANTDLPFTVEDATTQGWMLTSGKVEPNLGVRYCYGNRIPTKAAPLCIFYTPRGQLAGIRVEMFGEPKPALVRRQLWLPSGATKQYHIHVSFRNASAVASNLKQETKIGDRVLINADVRTGGIEQVPRTVDGAKRALWTRGSCIGGMGVHWMRDYVANGRNLTYYAANLLPVTVMYDAFTNDINAIFIFSTTMQQSPLTLNPRMWDVIPLTAGLWCKNLCDKANCQLKDDSWAVSTMHIYFKKPDTLKCPGGCKVQCCDGLGSV